MILNEGELISHKEIDNARPAGILDLLLDSVYTETPHLSLDELRAPGTGNSALSRPDRQISKLRVGASDDLPLP